MASNSEMYDELLRELEENTSLLLTPQQSKFLEDFKEAIKNEIPVEDTEDTQENMKEIVETFKKLSDINMNLKSIIGGLKIGKNARHKFFETYPKWNEVRKDAIKKLRDIAQAIQSNKKNCNVSRLVGYCTSLVGGGIALASAISIPLTLGLSTPLLVSGASLTAVGCSVSVGTSVTEIVMLKTEINKAKEIIEEDKKYFNEMNSWLEYSAKLDEVLSEIMKIDVIKSIAESVKDLVEGGTKIRNDHARYSFIINRMLTLLSPNMVQVVPIVVIAYGIWLLGNIFLLLQDIQNQLVFDCACLTMKSIIVIASLGDDVSDVVRITSLFTSNAALAKDIAKAVYRGVAATLGIGLDVIGITLTSIDIHKGSLSSEAKGIIKAADDLEEEAKILQKIYDDIKLSMDLEHSLENKVNKCFPESNIELSNDLEYSLEDKSNECHSENDFKKLQTQKKNKKNKKTRKNEKNKKPKKFLDLSHFITKQKNRMIVIKCVPNEIKYENILDVIINGNPIIIASENELKEFRILFTFEKFQYTRHLVAEVHPNMRESILELNRLKIAWNMCIVKDLEINNCYKCLGYNHLAKYCKNSRACYYCAKEHKSRNCPDKKLKVCINCIRRNQKIKNERKKLNVKHLPFSKSCSCHKFMINQVISKTDYE